MQLSSDNEGSGSGSESSSESDDNSDIFTIGSQPAKGKGKGKGKDKRKKLNSKARQASRRNRKLHTLPRSPALQRARAGNTWQSIGRNKVKQSGGMRQARDGALAPAQAARPGLSALPPNCMALLTPLPPRPSRTTLPFRLPISEPRA